MYGRNTNIDVIDDKSVSKDNDLTKRLIYTKTVLQHLKKQWSNEYLRELREQHQYIEHTRKILLSGKGDIVLLHGENLKRCAWGIGKIVESLKGRDSSIRATKINPITARCCLSITSENIKKTLDFLVFSGGIDKQHQAVMG